MMAAAFSPPSPFLHFFLLPHSPSFPKSCKTFPPSSSYAFSPLKYPSRKFILYTHSTHKFSQKNTQSWRALAASGDVLLADTPIEKTQQIVPADESGSVVISVLLTIAFVGLSILTIGVVYLGVTEFLQKREREKFEKEEAAKKKKSGKKGKGKVKDRTGPRGFGQKIEEDYD